MKDLMTRRLSSACRAMAGAVRSGAAAARRRAGSAGALAAILTAVAAVAAVAAPSAMAATAGTSAPHAVRTPTAPESSRRFTVTNISEYTLKLVKVVGDGHYEGRPADGSEIAPGGSQGWEVQLRVFRNQRDRATYAILQNAHDLLGYIYFDMELSGNYQPLAKCTLDMTNTTRIIGSCTHTWDSITFKSVPSTYTVTDPAQQSAILDQYCAGHPNTSCQFIPQSRDFVMGPPHQNGNRYKNTTGNPITHKFSVTSKYVATESVKVNGSAKSNIAKVLEVSLSKEYGRTWSEEHSWSEEFTQTITPGTEVWPEVEDPLVEDTGTFVMRLGDATWDLPDVTVTSPNPAGDLTVTFREAPI